MQTGQSLYLYLQQKVGAAYTKYLDTTKANRLLKDALISVVERVYKGDYQQKEWDDISFLTNTNVSLPVVSNYIQNAPVAIVGMTYNVPYITITTLNPHGFSVGSTFQLQNVLGLNTAPQMINGTTWTVHSVINQTSFTILVYSCIGTYTSGSGSILGTLYLNDYWHLLSVQCTFTAPIYNVSIANVSNSTPAIVTINTRSNIRTNDNLTISGVVGSTIANGTFYVKRLTDFTFALYQDENFSIPVANNSAYISGGTISRVSNQYAQPLTSKQKIGVLNTPTPNNPYFEIANNQVKIWPINYNCTQVLIDYIRQPAVIIDATNNTIDLTAYYPEKFLFTIVNEAQTLYAMLSRDNELMQTSSMELNKNP